MLHEKYCIRVNKKYLKVNEKSGASCIDLKDRFSSVFVTINGRV